MKQITIKKFANGDAQKLADLYLPVHLRDFYLTCHPLLQVWMYETSGSPEEFFSNVMMEWARFEQNRRGGWMPNGQWKPNIITEQLPILSNTVEDIPMLEMRKSSKS